MSEIAVYGVGRSGTSTLYSTIQEMLESEYSSIGDYCYEPFLWSPNVFNCLKKNIDQEFSYTESLSTSGMYLNKILPHFIKGKVEELFSSLDENSQSYLLNACRRKPETPYLLTKFIRANGRVSLFDYLNPEVRKIFILRNPVDVINSSIAMFSFYGDDFHSTDYPAFCLEVESLYGDSVKLTPRKTRVEREAFYWYWSCRYYLESTQGQKNTLNLVYDDYMENKAGWIVKISDFIEVAVPDDILDRSLTKVGVFTSRINLSESEYGSLGVYFDLYHNLIRDHFSDFDLDSDRALERYLNHDWCDNPREDKYFGRTTLYIKRQKAKMKTPLVPKVSVIIPVYNASATLDRCLDSVVNQDVKEIEVICVDDHSEDSSVDILCRRAAEEDRLVILRHQENLGAGAARNSGLDVARGEFVFHIDADDTLPAGALSKLYIEAETNQSDLVRGTFAYLHQDGTVEVRDWSSPSSRVINTNIRSSEFLQRIPGSHCAYLYRRAFLEKHGIRYPVDFKVGEDLLALTSILLAAERVTLVPDIIYHYHQSADSATRGPVCEKVLLDHIKTAQIMYGMLRDEGLKDAADDVLRRWDWPIETYFLRIPESMTAEASARVFEAWRESVKPIRIPWVIWTPMHYRYFMALMLARRDQEAYLFLASDAARGGFSDDKELAKCLELTLSIAPEDPGSLFEAGRLARRNGQRQYALSVFEKAMSLYPEYHEPKVERAATLRELGRLDEAAQELDKALELVVSASKVSGAVQWIFREKARLINTETSRKQQHDLKQAAEALKKIQGKSNALELDLHNAQGQLSLIHSKLEQATNECKIAQQRRADAEENLDKLRASFSWRITAPLRQVAAFFFSAFKGD